MEYLYRDLRVVHFITYSFLIIFLLFTILFFLSAISFRLYAIVFCWFLLFFFFKIFAIYVLDIVKYMNKKKQPVYAAEMHS